MTVHSWQELRARGLGQAQVRRLMRAGDLTKLGRDRYTFAEPATRAEQHLLAASGFIARTLSMESAALAHQLPVHRIPEAVQLICPGDGTSWRSPEAITRSGPLHSSEIVTVGPYQVTSVARTLVDLVRVRGPERGLLTWEAARRRAHLEKSLDELDEDLDRVLDRLARRRGIPSARIVREFASELSESPMESLSRWRLRELGWEQPLQQFCVLGLDGRELGRADFAWPDDGVLGEYDGEGKYDELARTGETPMAVLRREKRRQEAMELMGWTFARWNKQHLNHPEQLRLVLEQAFDRARRARPA